MTNEEAIGRIQEHRRIHSKKEPFTPYLDKAFDMAIEALEEQRPHGEWIRHIDDLYPEESTEECSVCHEEQRISGNDDNFCPNCGASMQANDRQVTGKLDENTQKHYGFRKKY